jgi:hypothetical protein
MIRSPRQQGPYIDRDLDCQEAVEPIFLREVTSADSAFMDLARIRNAVLLAALATGWTKNDLDDAVMELARCYAMKVRPVPS